MRYRCKWCARITTTGTAMIEHVKYAHHTKLKELSDTETSTDDCSSAVINSAIDSAIDSSIDTFSGGGGDFGGGGASGDF